MESSKNCRTTKRSTRPRERGASPWRLWAWLVACRYGSYEMKEIRLWRIIKSNGEPEVNKFSLVNQTETEKLLEDILVKSPDLLFPGLKLVGRQTDTPGGPLDLLRRICLPLALLGVDEDGRIVIFELKRGTLTRDAVAQLLDYASYLSDFELEELSIHISDRSGKLGIEKIDDFLAWYQEQFAKPLLKKQKPKLTLVGLGADDRTRRMVSFLADSDIDVSLITFHGFQDGENVILARQVEVETPDVTITKDTNLKKMNDKIAKLGVESFYETLAKYFQQRLSPAYQWPNQGGYSYYLPEITESGSQSNRVYLSLYLHDHKPGKTQIYMHPRALEALGEHFPELKTSLGDRVLVRKDNSAIVWISSFEEWSSISENFKTICTGSVTFIARSTPSGVVVLINFGCSVPSPQYCITVKTFTASWINLPARYWRLLETSGAHTMCLMP